jgi:excisionase family DNA binding protein
MNFNINDYLTVDQAAEQLGYTKANVTRLIRAGQLKAVKRGRRYLILPADIDAYIVGVEMFK